MSKHKRYPCIGTEEAVYPYPQSASVVDRSYANAMDILGSGKQDVVYPMYTVIHNTLARSRAAPKTDADAAFALPPAEFLLQHEAYLLHTANDSGFQNGLVMHSFLADIRTASGHKYALVINPPITFAQALRSSAIPASYHITCLFDAHTASIYQMDGTLQSFRTSTLQTYDRSKPYKVILIFYANSSGEDLRVLLTNMFPSGLPDGCKLHVVMPTTALSYQNAALRAYLANDLGLNHILVVDPSATHVAPSKRCLLTFGQQSSGLSIQRAGLTSKNNLRTGPNYALARDLFITSSKPLHQLHADVEQCSTSNGGRTRILKLMLSQHIVLMYRIERQRGENFRVIAYYTSVGSTSQRRKNIHGRGARISKIYRSHSMSSLEEVEAYLLDLLWQEDLAKVIRSDIADHVAPEDLDLVTLWYLHNYNLQRNTVYQHDLCTRFFLSLQPSDRLYGLTLSAPSELVQSALSDYTEANKLSANQQRMLIIQLRLVYNQACVHKYCLNNPYAEVMAARARKKREDSALPEASALRAIEQRSLDRVDSYLAQKHDLALNALICIKRHTGLSSAEIGALNWRDLEHMAHMDFKMLMISKHLPASGTTPVAFAAVEQNRVIPLPQIATEIQAYRRAELALAKAEGVADKDFLDLPMFHDSRDRNKRLRKNQINKMIKPVREALRIEHQYIPLPSENGVEQYDINRFAGDIFRSFYDLRIRDTVLFRDDGAYLLGNVIHSVACRHYRDYLHPLTQLMLYQIQNRCTRLLSVPQAVDTTQHDFSCNLMHSESLVIHTTAIVRTQTVISIYVPPHCDVETLIVQIQCRFGMDLTIAYAPNI